MNDDSDLRRREALRRLRPPDELFGRGDMGQWSRYERGGNEAAQIVFSAWDSGASSIFSGMENTELFTRHEAERRLRTKSLRRALDRK